MSSPLKIYQNFQKYPMGNYLFAKALCLKAPYFSTIAPQILNYTQGKIEIKMPKRKAIFNHIKTVHAIAMCNLAELCGGLTIDSILPKQWRWIPKGMNVEYLKKATTDLVGICEVKQENIHLGDNQVIVNVFNTQQELVFKATINMYVSEK